MIPSIVKQTCWKVAKVDSHEIRCAFAFTTLINTYISSTRHENWNYTDYLNLNGDLTRTKKEIFICLPTYLLYIFNIFYYSTFLYARLLTFFFRLRCDLRIDINEHLLIRKMDNLLIRTYGNHLGVENLWKSHETTQRVEKELS